MPPERHPNGWPPLPKEIERDRVEGQPSPNVMPLHELLRTWIDASPEHRTKALQALIGDDQRILDRIEKMLRNLDDAEIALIDASAIKGSDNLRSLYDRIGAGGTPLSSEERLFSFYKSIRPDFHNLVLQIYQETGRVMAPSKIAATAIRIANARAHHQEGAQNDRGNDVPDIVTFARAIEDEQSKLIDQLDQLCQDGGKKLLAAAFDDLFKAIRYTVYNKLGLPVTVIRQLPPQLIQVLLFWTLHTGKVFDQNANHVTRFCLAWLLASCNDDKGSRHCFQMIREKQDVTLRELFQVLADREDLTRLIISPDEMSEFLSPTNQAFIGGPSTTGLVATEPRVAALAKHWWHGEHRFLPWLQRDYLAAAFSEYDPLADREDDTPYDVDHMVPSSDWGFNWGEREGRLAPIGRFDTAQLSKLRWTRSDLGNSIGNKWLVDLSVNRAWQDMPFADKLSDVQTKKNEPEYSVLLIGAFDDQVAAVWQTASPPKEESRRDPPAWTDTRLRAFQTAVETRAAWLYERLYKEIGLSEWQVESAEPGEN